MPKPFLLRKGFCLGGGGGQRNLQGGAKTKCSPPDTEFDAGYFREGEDRLFKAAFFGRALFLPFCEVFVERDRRRAFVDFLPEFFPDKVVAGLERAVYFGQPPARREDFHGHLPVPFAGEETAVIVVLGIYEIFDRPLPFDAVEQQVGFGYVEHLERQRLVGKVVEKDLAVVVAVVTRHPLLFVKYEFVFDEQDHPAVRLLGKHQFAEHARGLDIPAFADPDHLFDEPGGIVGMFENLVADHIIESIFFERELLAVGFDELLVRVNQDFSAAMGVVVRKLDRKSTRLNSSHTTVSRMPSSA